MAYKHITNGDLITSNSIAMDNTGTTLQDYVEPTVTTGTYGETRTLGNGISFTRIVIPKSAFLRSSTVSRTVQGIVWYRSASVSILDYTPITISTAQIMSVSVGTTSGASGSGIYVPRFTGNTLYQFLLVSPEDWLESTVGYTNLTSVTVSIISRD